MNDDAGLRRPVLVAGAGPVGLACALALRAHDVRATVLEAEPEERIRPGSRAIYIHCSSLELLEHIRPGLGRALGRAGLVWSTKRTFWRGREVFARSYPAPPDDRLPPFTSLAQPEIERHLIAACKASDVEVVWDSRVEKVAAEGGEVRVTTSAGRVWSCNYLVGADGARSRVRDEIGLTMEGGRSDNAYVIVDVDEDPEDPRPIERVFHYEHPAVGGRNVLLVPFRGGWRADLQCRQSDDPERFSAGEGQRWWIGAVLGERYSERVAWTSTYHFLQVVARSFVAHSGRVLLVGEAAHLFAPFGARGLNSGIADACAAAAAIGAALAGEAEGREAIDRFASDRREAAMWNRRAAARALAIQSSGPWARSKRRLAAAAAPRSPRAAAWLDAAPYGPRLRDSRRRSPFAY